MRRGAAIALFVALLCGACSSSQSLVDEAAGSWRCSLTDRSDKHFEAGDITVVVRRTHTFDWRLEPPKGVDARDTLRFSGTWRLRGTTLNVTLNYNGPLPPGGERHTGWLRFFGVKKDARSVSVLGDDRSTGTLAVSWRGKRHVVFTQTSSNGQRSVGGGHADAYVADCRKSRSA